MFGKKAVVVLPVALAASLLQGCLSFVNMDLEKVSKNVGREPVASSPDMRVVLSVWVEGSHKLENPLSVREEEEKVAAVFERVRPEYGFLAKAQTPDLATTARAGSETGYTLMLDLTSRETVWGSPYISGYSLLVIPFSVKREREFRARLLDGCGVEIASHEAGMVSRAVVQLHLLWLAPVNLHRLTNPHPWVKAMRNLLDRVEGDVPRGPWLEPCASEGKAARRDVAREGIPGG